MPITWKMRPMRMNTSTDVDIKELARPILAEAKINV